MKSHANGLLRVLEVLLKDASSRCSIDSASIERDFATAKRRVADEGISFLTISLTNYVQDFERSLERGFVTSASFCGYKKRQCLPVFLQGFTRLVFDAGTGLLRQDASVDAILCIRQLCLYAKKILLPCTLRRERKAEDEYLDVESTLEQHQVPTELLERFQEVSAVLWKNVLPDSVWDEYPLPKHGPGATCEKISGNQKYSHNVWYERLQQYFPMDQYLFCSAEHLFDPKEGIEAVSLVPMDQELPVRVVFVPKTLKKPRVIAIEPVCMQYTQQAVSSVLIRELESHWITKGHVNFTRQDVNQSLAMTASVHRDLATLDLSAASDRVRNDMVGAMLLETPATLERLEACRSRSAILPSGRKVDLVKFASMGSATCFPVESMYFFTGVLTALLENHVGPVTPLDIHRISRSVYVYGDDIIVPVAAVESVSRTLTSLGCKVNKHKSFWNGHFRESCGCDAYMGERVTPNYIRHPEPRNKRNAAAIISWVKTSNLFYRSGFWNTANYLKEVVERIMGKLPIVADNSPLLGWESHQKKVSVSGWDKKLQSPYVKGYAPCSVQHPDSIDGYPALRKCLLNLERGGDRSPLEPIAVGEEHLQRSSRHGAVCLKRRRSLVT